MSAETARTGERPNIHEMYVVHRVFRREFVLMPALVRRVPEGDRRRAEVVAQHLRLILGGLHTHHSGEDEVLWPRLLERAAPSTALVETMQTQHERVEAYTAQIEPLVTAWASSASAVRGEQLASLVEDFATALFEHLDLEEEAVLPLISEHITVAEWKSLGEHGRGSVPLRTVPLLFGCVLEDADPQERAMMLGALPAPVRLVVRSVGRRHYRRYISRVRAA